MKDTSPEVEARYRQLLMQKTPAERVEMAGDMFDAAQELAKAGIRARMGDVDEGESYVQLFRQFYGSDFPPERKARIEARIREIHRAR
jgi:hypothetical protein